MNIKAVVAPGTNFIFSFGEGGGQVRGNQFLEGGN